MTEVHVTHTSKYVLKGLYWLVVMAAQIFTVWILSFWIDPNSTSMPRSFGDWFGDVWMLLLLCVVALSILGYAFIKAVEIVIQMRNRQ